MEENAARLMEIVGACAGEEIRCRSLVQLLTAGLRVCGRIRTGESSGANTVANADPIQLRAGNKSRRAGTVFPHRPIAVSYGLDPRSDRRPTEAKTKRRRTLTLGELCILAERALPSQNSA